MGVWLCDGSGSLLPFILSFIPFLGFSSHLDRHRVHFHRSFREHKVEGLSRLLTLTNLLFRTTLHLKQSFTSTNLSSRPALHLR